MIIVIGGGPAGFFGAIAARETDPSCPVVLLEKGGEVLRKVKVSGGGRCNVTHACFDPRDLTAHYPRGARELLGPFHHWGPTETVAWFHEHGVDLKTEPDGRMFPVTDDSGTIVTSLKKAAQAAGVEVLKGKTVTGIEKDGEGFLVRTASGDLPCDRILLAAGGRTSGGVGGYDLARALGHTLVDPVPSLFTLRCSDRLLDGLAGVAVDAQVEVAGRPRGREDLGQRGPLLITHRGLSGPAVIKLSAWGARDLHAVNYRFELKVDWLPDVSREDLDGLLQDRTRTQGKQQVASGGPGDLPRRLWTALVKRAGLGPDLRWADLGREARRALGDVLKDTPLAIHGQDTFKEEFVTCGGVARDEVDFRTMESRRCPGLYLAGEVIDVDGVTGGFNFQACWTTGRLAGLGLTRSDNE